MRNPESGTAALEAAALLSLILPLLLLALRCVDSFRCSAAIERQLFARARSFDLIDSRILSEYDGLRRVELRAERREALSELLSELKSIAHHSGATQFFAEAAFGEYRPGGKLEVDQLLSVGSRWNAIVGAEGSRIRKLLSAEASRNLDNDEVDGVGRARSPGAAVVIWMAMDRHRVPAGGNRSTATPTVVEFILHPRAASEWSAR